MSVAPIQLGGFPFQNTFFEKIPKDRQLLGEGKLPIYHSQWVYDINHDCLRTPSLRSWVKLVLAYNDMLPAENEYGEKQKSYDRDFQKRYPQLCQRVAYSARVRR